MTKTEIGKPQFAEVNHRFIAAAQTKRPLIAVHRGSPGGSIVENTAFAIEAALAEGADIVEIDIIRSTDGEFFVFHNGYERLYFGLERDIRDLSAAEIEELQYEDFVQKEVRPWGLEKLSTVLEAFPHALINIDRSWPYWDTLLDYLDGFNCCDRVILKAPAEAANLETLAKHSTPYPFIPIVKEKGQLELALAYKKVNTLAIEVLATEVGEYFSHREVIADLRSKGFLVLLNALNLPDRQNLYLGWDDETSVLSTPDQGWGKLIDQGADIIQTDWPSLLNRYLEERCQVAAAEEQTD
ncbi:glycerophosphodiester phosphodiesterase family protein [Corynebacterium sp.]|uniref:glycerophosphodiester phosphodiesterase family protein n=1 Tax=Corynebacterium sp. TaxID=1720 RepID=UPI0037361E04